MADKAELRARQTEAYLFLLKRIPTNRIADLIARADAGTLTSAERLALCVLAGGRLGEEAADKLIDAAMEEFGTGGYRVPVRVVGDPARLKVFITLPGGVGQEDVDRVAMAARDVLAGIRPPCLLVAAGATVQAFEVGPGGADVEVKEGG